MHEIILISCNCPFTNPKFSSSKHTKTSHGVGAFTMASTGILVMSPRMTRILLAGLLMVLDFTN
jgi:hypothetical protein